MKILLVHNTYQLSGGEDVVFSFERTLLIKNGNNVSIYKVDNDSINGVKSKLRTAISISYSNSSKNVLAKTLQEIKPDIVHVHNFFPLLTPSIYDACIDAGVPVVQTLHNYRAICPGALLMRDGRICEECVGGSAYHAVTHACYRDSRMASAVVARMVEFHRKHHTWEDKVDRFIALTDFAKEKFIQAGFPGNKIMVKPNFKVDSEVEYGSASGEQSYSLFVGRISTEKGIVTLLEAWKNIDFSLHLVGEGPLLSKAQSMESALITCYGHMAPEKVAMKMSQARFLIMPSEWYEGFPMVLVEAFAHGLPVIASRLGGMAEIVEDGKTGLHFEAGNTKDLADKVRWMQSHPMECKKMGENARQVYLQKYTPEKNYKRLMHIYHEAINDYG